MTPFEIFIYIIGLGFSFIIGFVSLWWKYEWGKKSLRDKRFLEEKTTNYNLLLDYMGTLTRTNSGIKLELEDKSLEEFIEVIKKHEMKSINILSCAPRIYVYIDRSASNKFSDILAKDREIFDYLIGSIMYNGKKNTWEQIENRIENKQFDVNNFELQYEQSHLDKLDNEFKSLMLEFADIMKKDLGYK